MTFWHGLIVGWLLGVATMPFLMLVAAKLMARSFDARDRRQRMSARWLRQRSDRGAPISSGAKRWLNEYEKGKGNGEK